MARWLMRHRRVLIPVAALGVAGLLASQALPAGAASTPTPQLTPPAAPGPAGPAPVTIPLPSPGPAPSIHTPAGPAVSYYSDGVYVDNGGYLLDWHGHAHGDVITINNTAFQGWNNDYNCVDGNLLGTSADVCESELIGTSPAECLNYDPRNDFYYLDGCDARDNYELNAWIPDGGGAGDYWVVQFGESNALGHYVYATATGFANGDEVKGEAAGFGNQATWLWVA
jgi:hypothetical protein